MNTIHDLGGMDGLTLPERDQGFPLHEQWERQVWGLVMSRRIPGYSSGGRAALERMPPDLYLSLPYYAKWLWREETAMLRAGIVTEGELDALSLVQAGYEALALGGATPSALVLDCVSQQGVAKRIEISYN